MHWECKPMYYESYLCLQDLLKPNFILTLHLKLKCYFTCMTLGWHLVQNGQFRPYCLLVSYDQVFSIYPDPAAILKPLLHRRLAICPREYGTSPKYHDLNCNSLIWVFSKFYRVSPSAADTLSVSGSARSQAWGDSHMQPELVRKNSLVLGTTQIC